MTTPPPWSSISSRSRICEPREPGRSCGSRGSWGPREHAGEWRRGRSGTRRRPLGGGASCPGGPVGGGAGGAGGAGRTRRAVDSGGSAGSARPGTGRPHLSCGRLRRHRRRACEHRSAPMPGGCAGGRRRFHRDGRVRGDASGVPPAFPPQTLVSPAALAVGGPPEALRPAVGAALTGPTAAGAADSPDSPDSVEFVTSDCPSAAETGVWVDPDDLPMSIGPDADDAPGADDALADREVPREASAAPSSTALPPERIPRYPEPEPGSGRRRRRVAVS